MKIKRTIVSGRVVEQQLMNMPAARFGKRAPKRKGATTAGQKSRNMKAKVRKLARLINANFTRVDYALIMTYAANPSDVSQCERDLKKFVRKLKRLAKKHGYEIRWIAVISVKNGAKDETVRTHIHVLIGSEGFLFAENKLFFCGKDIEEFWPNGLVKIQHVNKTYDHTGYAKYLLDQAHEGKYHAARGMIKPVVKDDYAIGIGVLTARPGDYVVDRHDDEEHGYHYMRCVIGTSDRKEET